MALSKHDCTRVAETIVRHSMREDYDRLARQIADFGDVVYHRMCPDVQVQAAKAFPYPHWVTMVRQINVHGIHNNWVRVMLSEPRPWPAHYRSGAPIVDLEAGDPLLPELEALSNAGQAMERQRDRNVTSLARVIATHKSWADVMKQWPEGADVLRELIAQEKATPLLELVSFSALNKALGLVRESKHVEVEHCEAAASEGQQGSGGADHQTPQPAPPAGRSAV